MGKVNQMRQDRMETDDFKFGWESAERGEPWPNWHVHNYKQLVKIENQRFGWLEYHADNRGEAV